jgi:hypothetical protein
MAKQLDMFEDQTKLVSDFVSEHSASFTEDVVDSINERLTDIFNDEGFDDYDVMSDIAEALMKRIGENLQSTPENWN